MAELSPTDSVAEADRLNLAADQAIAACGGDAREAVKALLVANEFLEREIEGFAGISARCEARAV
jgi:hypothetical protein